MKMFSLLSIGIITLILSCSANKKIAAPATPFYETNWLLKKIYTAAGTEMVQTKAFITFKEANKSAGGNGSCNSFGSSITITNNEIRFTGVFSTKMYCEEVQKTEDAFFKQLEKATRFEIKGNILSLYQGEKILLEFASE